jgi:hypothetical protein
MAGQGRWLGREGELDQMVLGGGGSGQGLKVLSGEYGLR